MIGRCVLIAFCLLTPLCAVADEPAQTAAEESQITRDVLYFHRDYPIFIRVHIETDGVPFTKAWREYVESLFAVVDADKDGRLTADELAATSNAGKKNSPDVLRLVRDRDLWSADRKPFDKSISLEELKSYLISRQRGPFQHPGDAPPPTTTNNLGASLFGLLDINADRSLSAAELASAMTSLHRRDLDDDGTFGVAELLSGQQQTFFRQPEPDSPLGRRPFIALIPGTVSLDVLRELERRYATSPLITSESRETLSRDLQRRDLGFQAKVFNEYDLDQDGALDRTELREFVRNATPSLELLIRLGKRNDDEPVVELIRSARKDVAVRQSSGGLASLVIGTVQIEISSTVTGPDVAKQYLLRQFKSADRDQNGYIDEDESARNNSFRASFDQFDEDGDGKVFEGELASVVDSRTKSARSRTRMDVRNRGRDLFEILDVDRNRSLGRRELAQAVKRIELWDTDKDGAISESEIPQLFQVSFGPGQPQFRGVQIPGQRMRTSDDGPKTNAAPKWFTRLDRNGDGELARREFPGTQEEFNRIDRNSDGVVDVAESEFAK